MFRFDQFSKIKTFLKESFNNSKQKKPATFQHIYEQSLVSVPPPPAQDRSPVRSGWHRAPGNRNRKGKIAITIPHFCGFAANRSHFRGGRGSFPELPSYLFSM